MPRGPAHCVAKASALTSQNTRRHRNRKRRARAGGRLCSQHRTAHTPPGPPPLLLAAAAAARVRRAGSRIQLRHASQLTSTPSALGSALRPPTPVRPPARFALLASHPCLPPPQPRACEAPPAAAAAATSRRRRCPGSPPCVANTEPGSTPRTDDRKRRAREGAALHPYLPIQADRRIDRRMDRKTDLC